MTSPTHVLRDEHKSFGPQVEKLLQVADSVGYVPGEQLRTALDCSYAFLTDRLLPHARTEETSLYREVGRILGSHEATMTMCQDHLVIGQMTEELGTLRTSVAGTSLSTEQARALRRVLYGLHALISAHFAKEEEIYIPLIERNSTLTDAKRISEVLHGAAHTTG